MVLGPLKDRVAPLIATAVLPRGVNTLLPAVRSPVAALLPAVAKGMVEDPRIRAPDGARE